MNGTRKFHKPNGPAFDVGQEWRGISGNFSCFITGVKKFGDGKFDYRVFYRYEDGVTCDKDCWSFQVRYEHVADRDL
jgi:hypothetical protein